MIRIIIAGDFVPRYRIARQIEVGNFSCIEEIRSIIKSVDYAIVNLESPLVKHATIPIRKTGPNLYCTENAMACIVQAGFECVTLANNHFRDYGQVGVEDTIEACNKYAVDYVGGGKTIKEAHGILYKDIKSQRLAIINVCEHEWSIATVNSGGSNPLDIVSASRAIREAKKTAKYVLVIIHGGTECYNLPTPRMKDTYHFFVEQGADAVINHHQHCYSGYELYLGKPIFYGLGNFCFDNPNATDNKLWEEGFMVELILNDTIDFRLHPYVQCDKDNPSVKIMKNRKSFDDDIHQLNRIIANDVLLQQYFGQMAIQRESIANNILIPYSSSFLKKLCARKVIPSFVNNFRKMQLLANIQCEAHRDVLLYVLSKTIKK